MAVGTWSLIIVVSSFIFIFGIVIFEEEVKSIEQTAAAFFDTDWLVDFDWHVEILSRTTNTSFWYYYEYEEQQ